MADTNRSPRKPRYRELAETLMADIRSGRLAVGDKLPGEIELTEQHSVSRHTVRESLRVLEDLGLIERSPRLGTTVKALHSEPDFVYRVRSPEELLRYPEDSRLTLLHSAPVKMTRALAKTLGIPQAGEWTCLSAIRRQRGDGQPLCWSDIYVRSDYAKVANRIGHSPKPVYALIEEAFDIRSQSIDVEVCGANLEGERATALATADPTPAIRLIRRYRGAGVGFFEVSVTDHIASQFSFTLAMQRGWRVNKSND